MRLANRPTAVARLSDESVEGTDHMHRAESACRPPMFPSRDSSDDYMAGIIPRYLFAAPPISSASSGQRPIERFILGVYGAV